jgi:L,D-peptidoglycan transpeptidase YkuD (ErfK/YbiS/YcfS/YnhG family)
MRRSTIAAFVALSVAALSVVALSFASQAQAATVHRQVITVEGATASATTAKLTLWEMNATGKYVAVWGPFTAWVGELGIGTAHEGVARTPAGVFGLTQAFGNRPNNGTRLPYFQANRADWWNGEVSSPQYNTHVHQANSPGPASENLYTAGFVYSHAVVIDYNRFPVVKGAGSAFFFHVSNNQPTAGCVAIGSAHLDRIMQWLDPAKSPVMSIGVGARATALITNSNAALAKHNPRGYFDAARPVAPGRVRFVGWGFDPDSKSAAVRIEIFVDGHRITIVSTGARRPDVQQVFGVGPNQGFDVTLPVAAGSHTFCTSVDNIGWGTGNVRIRCLTGKVA